MKKLLLVAVILSVFTVLIHAEDNPYVTVFKGVGSNYNDILEGFTTTSYEIIYKIDTQTYVFAWGDTIKSGYIYLSSENIESIRLTLKKWLEWEKLAIENNVEIEKEITDSSISGVLMFEYGDTYYFASSITLYFTFFSQNTERHQLVIASSKETAKSNEYIYFQLDQIYSDHDEVIEFLNGISEKAVKKAIDSYNKTKKDEELFQ